VEAQHWRRIVNSRPPDWCTAEIYGVLKQLCRHEALADQLAMMRQGCTNIFEMDAIMKAEMRQSTLIATLVVRLGLNRNASRSVSEAERSRGAEGEEGDPWET
jgi:predicted amino acid racemase